MNKWLRSSWRLICNVTIKSSCYKIGQILVKHVVIFFLNLILWLLLFRWAIWPKVFFFYQKSLENHQLIHELLKVGTFKSQYIVKSFKQSFNSQMSVRNIPYELNRQSSGWLIIECKCIHLCYIPLHLFKSEDTLLWELLAIGFIITFYFFTNPHLDTFFKKKTKNPDWLSTYKFNQIIRNFVFGKKKLIFIWNSRIMLSLYTFRKRTCMVYTKSILSIILVKHIRYDWQR